MAQEGAFMKAKFYAVLVPLIFSACASKDKAKDIKTELDRSQQVQGENLGIKDGNVVVQRKVLLSEELRKLQTEVFEQEYKLYGNPYGSKGLKDNLKECYEKLSDPRIGGSGKPQMVGKIDKLTANESKLNFGIDEKDQLVSVTEEGLTSRIGRFKSYRDAYEDRLNDMQIKIDTCEQDYKTALINNGLNPNDTKAEGRWVTRAGKRVWEAKKTASDDPEELSRRKAEKEKEAQ
jgi:hypothetical protein